MGNTKSKEILLSQEAYDTDKKYFDSAKSGRPEEMQKHYSEFMSYGEWREEEIKWISSDGRPYVKMKSKLNVEAAIEDLYNTSKISFFKLNTDSGNEVPSLPKRHLISKPLLNFPSENPVIFSLCEKIAKILKAYMSF